MKTTLLTKIVYTALIKWNFEKFIGTNFCLTPLDSYTIIVQPFFAQRIPVITILWHRTIAHSGLILYHKQWYAEFIFDLLSWNSSGAIIRVLDFCAMDTIFWVLKETFKVKVSSWTSLYIIFKQIFPSPKVCPFSGWEIKNES